MAWGGVCGGGQKGWGRGYRFHACWACDRSSPSPLSNEEEFCCRDFASVIIARLSSTWCSLGKFGRKTQAYAGSSDQALGVLVEKRRLQAPQRRQYTTLQAFPGEWTSVCKRPRRHPATIANATINEAVCQFQRELNALRRCSPCRLPRMGNSWRRQRKAMRGLGCGLFRTRAKRLKVFVGRSWRQPCRKLFAPCRRVVCRSKCLAAVGEVFRGAFVESFFRNGHIRSCCTMAVV